MSERERLERFLRTDPRDVGCEEAMAVLHVYVDLAAAGGDAAEAEVVSLLEDLNADLDTAFFCAYGLCLETSVAMLSSSAGAAMRPSG